MTLTFVSGTVQSELFCLPWLLLGALISPSARRTCMSSSPLAFTTSYAQDIHFLAARHVQLLLHILSIAREPSVVYSMRRFRERIVSASSGSVHRVFLFTTLTIIIACSASLLQCLALLVLRHPCPERVVLFTKFVLVGRVQRPRRFGRVALRRSCR